VKVDPRYDWRREPGAEITKVGGRVFRVGMEVFVHDTLSPPDYPLSKATISGVRPFPKGSGIFEVELASGHQYYPSEHDVHIPGEEPRCHWCRQKERFDEVRGIKPN
jgi:hypothetical protein